MLIVVQLMHVYFYKGNNKQISFQMCWFERKKKQHAYKDESKLLDVTRSGGNREEK